MFSPLFIFSLIKRNILRVTRCLCYLYELCAYNGDTVSLTVGLFAYLIYEDTEQILMKF
jgi:hypothetical protein